MYEKNCNGHGTKVEEGKIRQSIQWDDPYYVESGRKRNGIQSEAPKYPVSPSIERTVPFRIDVPFQIKKATRWVAFLW